MTKRQILKLHTIIAKLEALERNVRGSNDVYVERLSDAKTHLLRALDEVEK